MSNIVLLYNIRTLFCKRWDRIWSGGLKLGDSWANQLVWIS